MDKYKSTNEKLNLFKYAINIELLEYGDIGDRFFYNDELFTGLGYELYQNGNIRELIPYENGFANGMCREWYSTGELMREYELRRGSSHGRKIYWYKNGSIKLIANYEFGIELDYQEWDEKGNLIENRELDSNDPNSNYSTLLRLRESENKNNKME
ncbi:toxin-antitoxin system YwqK family antitoxin [Tepidibacter hydrothermalis]|uniref:Uncharacterized protein n=1 Tax=Tepidibacter hydrothermalis TaxID=3036126 RepID=A0ABY8E7S7_9FIRM|nr:hypothetical protein [Tepidibacter hydrothermalis]WFD08961.1 hypothetical protein P4S50_11235 [Tepidibacter hydrothermalis]